MATDFLIDHLTRDLLPVRHSQGDRPLLTPVLAGVAVTGLAVLGALGLRADFAEAVHGPLFWIKLGAMAWVAAGALLTVYRLGIPGSASPSWALTLAPPLTVLLAIALAEWSTGSGGVSFWLGTSWRRCSIRIALLAVPSMALLLRAVARLAPTQAPQAGLATGLAAGALAAAVYSLSCGETSAGFVLVWYGLGVGTPALLGAALGPWLLRW